MTHFWEEFKGKRKNLLAPRRNITPVVNSFFWGGVKTQGEKKLSLLLLPKKKKTPPDLIWSDLLIDFDFIFIIKKRSYSKVPTECGLCYMIYLRGVLWRHVKIAHHWIWWLYFFFFGPYHSYVRTIYTDFLRITVIGSVHKIKNVYITWAFKTKSDQFLKP